MQVHDQLGSEAAHRKSEVLWCSVCVAGIDQDVTKFGASTHHALEHTDEGSGRIDTTCGEHHPSNELGDRFTCFFSHHGGGLEVVAEEHLGLSWSAFSVTPPGFWVGARSVLFEWGA